MAQVIDVRGTFDILQRTIIDGNEVRVGFNVTFVLEPAGDRFNLNAGAVGGDSPHTRGSIKNSGGYVTDTYIIFYVDWEDGKTGKYEGFIYPDHYLRGVTNDISDPAAAQPQTAEWWTANNNFWLRDI
jgi:hypothetical protein